VTIETRPLDNAPLFRAGAFALTTPRGRDVTVLNPDRLAEAAFKGKEISGRGWVGLANGRGEIRIP